MQKSVKTIGIVCFVLLLCMSFVLAACGTSPAGPEITKITLDKDTLSMQIGDEAILTATVEPVDQAANIVWTCDKDTVVKVENGKVTALSAGTAVVSAQNRAGTVYASCTIIVEEKANSVTLDKKALEMVVGEEQTLNATVDPTSVANKLVWKCSPVGIVKVEGGKVTALSAGTATVTVSDPTGTKSDSCVVTVYAVATDITLDKTAVNMYVGDEQTIVATVTPQGTNSVAFNSNNTDVATVDDSGKIVAVGVGTANITVVLDGIEKTCVVTVYNKVTEITLNVQTLALYVGETHDLAVVTTPANNVKAPQFASANEEVATVDANGVITVVGAGTTTITATIDDVTASVTVSAVKVAFEQANYSLALNVEQQLALTFEPASAAVENVTYGSSAAGIVSVDAEGKVKAKAYGQAVITASVENKFSVTCTVTVSPLATEDGVSVEYGENGYAIRTEAGMHVNALNLGAQAASKIYYAEYTLNGMNLHDGQAKSFGMAHFATSESYMFDAFHMYLSGKDVTEAGFWHRMNNKLDLENGLLLNQANAELGAVHNWLIDMLKNGKSVKMGIARNGNDVYTLFNGVIVMKTQIADGLKDTDTLPAIMMNATDGDTRTITDVVYLSGEAAINKLNASAMLVKSITVGNDELTLIKNERKTLTAAVDPSYAADRLVWESSNNEVATVDNGIITAVGTGNVTITAKIGDVKAEILVTVVDFKFEQQNYSLNLNDTEKLNLVFDESAGEVPTIDYRSSNEGIASIGSDGTVTAKAYGRVTIAAVINDIEIKCTVTVSPLATNNGVNVTYNDDGTYNTVNVLAGINVNAVNTGVQPSKIYYAEYVLKGLELYNGQAKSFGMAHFATSESYMFDAFHMYLSGKDVTEAGFWHRMNVGGDLEKGLLLNQANVELGMVRDWIIDAIQNKKSLKVGIARNGNYIYTFINDVIVLQANIADVLKGADTAPAIFMNATDGESRTVGNIVFLEGEAAVNKINDAKRMLRYSRIVDNYMPATIAADNSSFRFDGADDSDAAWRASVTQEIVFGANTTIEMDVVVRNNADGHIAINIARNDGNGWTSKNNFTDGLTLVGYWMWTNGGKQQGVDYLSDNLTTWTNEWCGGPAEENKSGNFHIKIDLSRNEDGRVKSVLTISNGDTLMQTVEKTSVDVHDLNEQYRIHFLTHAIDYEVSNLTIVEKN